jgi:hypothetical protein
MVNKYHWQKEGDIIEEKQAQKHENKMNNLRRAQNQRIAEGIEKPNSPCKKRLIGCAGLAALGVIIYFVVSYSGSKDSEQTTTRSMIGPYNANNANETDALTNLYNNASSILNTLRDIVPNNVTNFIAENVTQIKQNATNFLK